MVVLFNFSQPLGPFQPKPFSDEICKLPWSEKWMGNVCLFPSQMLEFGMEIVLFWEAPTPLVARFFTFSPSYLKSDLMNSVDSCEIPTTSAHADSVFVTSAPRRALPIPRSPPPTPQPGPRAVTLLSPTLCPRWRGGWDFTSQFVPNSRLLGRTSVKPRMESRERVCLHSIPVRRSSHVRIYSSSLT